jgi:hypothetical protein
MSTSVFQVPPFQREYSWTRDEIGAFWDDLRASLDEDSYFLGLIILTELPSGRKQVVDGQQRLLTLTLLAAALYREAIANKRQVLADRLRAEFLEHADYQSDKVSARMQLADPGESRVLQRIIDGEPFEADADSEESFARRLRDAFVQLSSRLHRDLARDPFRLLGAWADFLSDRLQFAVFLHPDAASAYRVFEVINTRGKELTTADLLKNFVLSQLPEASQEAAYQRWQRIARPLSVDNPNVFVQYIRHVVTVENEYVATKDLFDYLARRRGGAAYPPTPEQLLDVLDEHVPLYSQMIDPDAAGPAGRDATQVFAALNELNVIAVRPLLLAIHGTPDDIAGMHAVLELVVRRVATGGLGTGNVERRLGDAATLARRQGRWEEALHGLRDLNPDREDFAAQVGRRAFTRSIVHFLRRSVVQQTHTPSSGGYLHTIRPRQAPNWPDFPEDEFLTWGLTIGNSLLASEPGRPSSATTWEGVRQTLLPLALPGEWTEFISEFRVWDVEAVRAVGASLGQAAADVWYA